MKRHKLRVFRGSQLSLWYVECSCGWRPNPSRSSGFHGRAHWGTALAIGVDHQREEVLKPWKSTTTTTVPGVQISS